MEVLNLITKIITFVFSALVAYRFIYILIGVFTKKKNILKQHNIKDMLLLFQRRMKKKL